MVHFWIAFAFLILGRARRMDQRGIDDSALAQRKPAIAQIAVDNAKAASSQLVLLQQAAEVEDSGFVRDTFQAQACKLAQDGRFGQRFFHRRIAIAEPVCSRCTRSIASNG
ncbi:MAG: hypothetical protein BCV62_17050 [Pseudomonas sp. K35]|uniref:Uncharacterized protein n=1 Tax=Stutzerimonas stutzeri TaxID=316 RepID=A0A0D7E469_STUST|nr:hypothetical protein LO50_14305 [Stutzerimonas stutzeri]OCX93715.1 MAG: hypothetical protein BCV62_17050 [Pseudomonas sp. K35]